MSEKISSPAEKQPEYPPHWEKVGDKILIPVGNDKVIRQIRAVTNARKFVEQFGLNITRNIPIYELDEPFDKYSDGAYFPGLDAIVTHRASTPYTIEHELVHAIECHQEVSPALQQFFEKVVALFPEEIEYEGFTFFNYKKNIHEFIVEGYTQPLFIKVLTQHQLYDEFLHVTAYLQIRK